MEPRPPASPPRRRSGLPFRPTARLRLERLEGRAVPAAVNWTLGADGNFANASAWTVAGTSPPQPSGPGPAAAAGIPRNFSVTPWANQTRNNPPATNLQIPG